MQSPIQIFRKFSGFFSPMKFATDPNLSYWLLRIVLNTDRNLNSSLRKYMTDFFKCVAQEILSLVPMNSPTSSNFNNEANTKLQMIYRSDTNKWEIEGCCLLRILNFLHMDAHTSCALNASSMLSVFLGRCTYFETTLKKDIRPRLCAEVTCTRSC